MSKTIAIGIQDFQNMISNHYFYIDKTYFIKEWWENGAFVTHIARPQGFGKTLNLSMIEYFFSVIHTDKRYLFEGLEIWKDEKYRLLQGTYPVIHCSFQNVKDDNYEAMRKHIFEIIASLYKKYSFIKENNSLSDRDKTFWNMLLSQEANDISIGSSLFELSRYLYHYYDKKVIILLDDYDTPIQTACEYGFYNDLMYFLRSLFLSTFKTNEYLDRAIMLGNIAASNDMIFEYLNMDVIPVTSNKYATSFGFTENEILSILKEYDLEQEKESIQNWYGGFIFGKYTNIYNPWSVLNFLDKRKYEIFWNDINKQSLLEKLLQKRIDYMKKLFEMLLKGHSIQTSIDEQIIYDQLYDTAIWSILFASGYLKALNYAEYDLREIRIDTEYELTFTNNEARSIFDTITK